MIHIYGQYAHHSNAHIVATKQALTRLRDAINKVLETDKPVVMESMVGDGEGYSIFVNVLDEEKFDTLAVPYIAGYAVENRENAVWPHQLIKSPLVQED